MWGKIIGGVIGFFVGGPAGAMAGAAAGDALIDQPLTQKEQAGAVIAAQKEIAAEKLAAETEAATRFAGERLAFERQLTEKQMKWQMGQQQIELLANLFSNQDRTESQPRILTLPSAGRSEPGIFGQVNLFFDQLLHG